MSRNLLEVAYRLAMADAMQLHDERVARAIERSRLARAELEAAESHQRAVIEARNAFKASIRDARPTAQGTGAAG